MSRAASVDDLLDEAESRPVRGWDFGWLGDRVVARPVPWNFEEIVVSHARESPDMLDMGTGGGEWLAALAYRPPRAVATEAWPPNLEIAGARLRPLGITVVAVEAAPDNVEQHPDEERGRLPFPTPSFSLVCNRHESFVAGEVARVLDPGGTFVTQQVGGDYDAFHDALDLPHPVRVQPRWDLWFATQQLDSVGLRVVDGCDGVEETSFADAGALAWYLKAIPWIVEDFSIAAYRAHLGRLQERIENAGPLTIRHSAFWLEAIRNA
jgi:SAM-dependent methyltransferase